MDADAYRRARRLLSGGPNAVVRAQVLGVLHSLLVLGLLAVIGLLFSLLATRGVARWPTERIDELPAWLSTGAMSGQGQVYTYFQNTGLLPIAAENRWSANPAHRWAARVLQAVLARVATLRNNLGALTTLAVVALTLLIVLCFLAQYRRNVMATVASELATTLRRQIHRQMYRLGQSSMPTEGTGPAVNLLTREVNDVRDGLFAELDYGYRMPVLAAGLAAFALFISPTLTLFLASLGALVWLAARAMSRDARLISDAAMRNAAMQLVLLHEDLALLRTVRIYGMEQVDKQRFDEHLERFRAADERRIKTEGRLTPMIGLLYGSTATLAICLIGYSVAVSQRISIASALVLLAALVGLAYPWFGWNALRRATRQANRSAESLLEFMERKPELQQAGVAQFLPPMRDRISLENITLESRTGRVLLDGVSAEFPAGIRTAIMGLDEDAKHAMVCLIPRLIDPTVGRVRIDGLDLRDVTLESIRAQVATVLQADLVFTDSVLMNIGLGDPSYTLPRVMDAAKLAHAHNFIQDLPHGYDTIIGPLGQYLSPDEQFRIGLARAYLHDPSIVIIEEPNVPIEDEVKPLIDDSIARLSQGRTLIILPHRLQTIRACQQVIVLQNGRIESSGPPRQLENDSKFYRHLQYIEFNQFATGDVEEGALSA
jgi:ABC-type multidrug transport system fused ATPase/permease subunit